MLSRKRADYTEALSFCQQLLYTKNHELNGDFCSILGELQALSIFAAPMYVLYTMGSHEVAF